MFKIEDWLKRAKRAEKQEKSLTTKIEAEGGLKQNREARKAETEK